MLNFFSKFTTWREVRFFLTHPHLWQRRPLSIGDMNPDPLVQFSIWFSTAQKKVSGEFANWMCLSTIDVDGYPDARIVLLKSYSKSGFVFYTNKESNKGRQILDSSHVALTFYWQELQWQIRVRGICREVDSALADTYFHSRPRESQLGAWASAQSRVIEGRKELIDSLEEATSRFEGQIVPRPVYWTGFIVEPLSFEFWELRLSRLHDRFLYQKDLSRQDDSLWDITQLSP